ncbi:MAG: hypothetical protein WD491_14830 [Balneolales bacterium]
MTDGLDNTHTYKQTVTAGNGPTTQVESDVQKSMNYKTMDYTELVPVLIKAMQEQQEEIEQLKEMVKDLKGE